MTTRIRDVVADDSAIARRFIAGRLARDNDLDLVATAESGAGAIRLVDEHLPDVLVLDDEMPEMTGRQVLRALRKQHPEVAVVMFSGSVGAGTAARFEALVLGADDAVAKPRSTGGPVTDGHPTWTELLVKVKRAARRQERGGVALDVVLDALPPGVPAPVPPRAPADVRPPTQGTALPGTSRAPDSDPVDGGGVVPAGPGTSVAPPGPALRDVGGRQPPRPRSVPRPVRPAPALSATGPAGCVVVASSTGGPDALRALLCDLPGGFPLPVVIVQHMPATFTSLLAKRLDGASPLRVIESQGDEVLEPGCAYLAPGAKHLVVDASSGAVRTRLTQEPPENSCRPAADVLFRSAVAVHGAGVLGVVLSGMGRDGLLGCQQIRSAGGSVVVQDEASSVVWGMPGAVAASQLADRVLPIDALAASVLARSRRIASAVRREPAGASR